MLYLHIAAIAKRRFTLILLEIVENFFKSTTVPVLFRLLTI